VPVTIFTLTTLVIIVYSHFVVTKTVTPAGNCISSLSTPILTTSTSTSYPASSCSCSIASFCPGLNCDRVKWPRATNAGISSVLRLIMANSWKYDSRFILCSFCGCRLHSFWYPRLIPSEYLIGLVSTNIGEVSQYRLQLNVIHSTSQFVSMYCGMIIVGFK
jgi:hypothetical protein